MEEAWQMSAISQERLLAGAARPADLRKGDRVADKNEQVVFKVASGCDQTRSEGGGRVALQGRGEVGQILNVKGKSKRFRGPWSPRKGLEEGYVVTWKPGQEINFAAGVIDHGNR